MNKINLIFDNTLSSLAGNSYGKEIYDEQVKPFIDFDIVNLIIFPNNIEKIAISFIQGFTREIISKIGIEGFRKNIKIEVSNEKLKNKILGHIG